MRAGSYRAAKSSSISIYEQDFDRDSNTIEVFVGRLRKKLGVEVIQTMRGLGYLLAAPDTKDAVGKPPRADPSARD
jgi:two-component system OmpR family response regulator